MFTLSDENPMPERYVHRTTGIPLGVDTDEMIAMFGRDELRRGMRPRSIHRRRDVLRAFARHHGSLLDATADDIYAWLEHTPIVARTTRNYLSSLSGFYAWAILIELTDHNPAGMIPKPKVPIGLPRPIRSDDLAFAVGQAPPTIKAWLLLAALAGLRCQEIAGLERDHILDYEDPPLLLVVHGKGGRERVLPLHPDVLAALRVAGLPRTGPLFRTQTGRQRPPDQVSAIVSDYLHGIGVEASAHMLRHAFATSVYRASRDIRLTQDLLGHASPVTTAIYTQTSPLDAVKVVNGLSIG